MLIRAFNLANGVAPDTNADDGIDADDYVTKNELRCLMAATQSALKIYRLFDVADTSDDRKCSREEWDAQLPVMNEELRESPSRVRKHRARSDASTRAVRF